MLVRFIYDSIYKIYMNQLEKVKKMNEIESICKDEKIQEKLDQVLDSLIDYVIIYNGMYEIDQIKMMNKYNQKSYNKTLKELNYQYIWRPTEVSSNSKKYLYHYWYKWYWDSDKKQTRHKYIGKQKPDFIEIDPPEYIELPSRSTYVEIQKGTIEIEYKEFKQYQHLFKNCRIEYMMLRVPKASEILTKLKENLEK